MAENWDIGWSMSLQTFGALYTQIGQAIPSFFASSFRGPVPPDWTAMQVTVRDAALWAPEDSDSLQFYMHCAITLTGAGGAENLEAALSCDLTRVIEDGLLHLTCGPPQLGIFGNPTPDPPFAAAIATNLAGWADAQFVAPLRISLPVAPIGVEAFVSGPTTQEAPSLSAFSGLGPVNVPAGPGDEGSPPIQLCLDQAFINAVLASAMPAIGQLTGGAGSIVWTIDPQAQMQIVPNNPPNFMFTATASAACALDLPGPFPRVPFTTQVEVTAVGTLAFSARQGAEGTEVHLSFSTLGDATTTATIDTGGEIASWLDYFGSGGVDAVRTGIADQLGNAVQASLRGFDLKLVTLPTTTLDFPGVAPVTISVPTLQFETTGPGVTAVGAVSNTPPTPG